MKKIGISIGRTETIVKEYFNFNHAAKGGNLKAHLKKGERGKHYSKNVYANTRKAKETIRKLITNNFDCENATFVTLTFSDEAYKKIVSESNSNALTDVYKTCNIYFNKFMRRAKYQYSDLFYVAVPELQKNRGDVIHYHMIWNVHMKNAELQKLWQYGITHKTKPYDVTRLSGYLSKQKVDKSKASQFKPHYLSSKGLMRNQDVFLDETETECQIILSSLSATPNKQDIYGIQDVKIIKKVYSTECVYDVLPAATKKRK